MSSVLVLLALLSMATLAARRGSAETLINLASAPLLVTLGLLLSPDGLGFLLPSTAEALTPALRVGIAWLALVIGLRTRSPLDAHWASDAMWLMLVGALGLATVGTAAYATLVILDTSGIALPGVLDGSVPKWAMAIAMGAIFSSTSLSAMLDAVQSWPESTRQRRLLFMARHDGVFGVVGVILVMACWDGWAVTGAKYPAALPVLAVAAVGAVMAAGALMLGAGRMHVTGTARLSVVALIVTGAGLCGMAAVPETAATWIMGFILTCLGVSNRLLSPAMRDTDRPVRLVVLVLAGVHMELSPGTLLMGLALTVGRVASRLVLWSILRPMPPLVLRPPTLLTSPALTVPFAMSLTLAMHGDFEGTSLLTSVVIAVGLTDLLTLLWGFGQRARGTPITLPKMPAAVTPEPRP